MAGDTRPAAFSSGSSDSFRQNSTASSHDTYSTGNRFVSCPATLSFPLPVRRELAGVGAHDPLVLLLRHRYIPK